MQVPKGQRLRINEIMSCGNLHKSFQVMFAGRVSCLIVKRMCVKGVVDPQANNCEHIKINTTAPPNAMFLGVKIDWKCFNILDQLLITSSEELEKASEELNRSVSRLEYFTAKVERKISIYGFTFSAAVCAAYISGNIYCKSLINCYKWFKNPVREPRSFRFTAHDS